VDARECLCAISRAGAAAVGGGGEGEEGERGGGGAGTHLPVPHQKLRAVALVGRTHAAVDVLHEDVQLGLELEPGFEAR